MSTCSRLTVGVVSALVLQCASAIAWPSLSLHQLLGDSRRSAPFQSVATDAAKPWFCHSNECPPFEVVKSTPNYEVREYESGEKWVYSSTSGLVYSSAVSTGFKNIYKYFDGENDKKIKVPLTTPVLTRIMPANSSFSRSNYTVAVWLPKEFQDSPPQPTTGDVAIAAPPSGIVVYVLQFGGFLVDDVTVDLHAKKLKQSLLEDRVEFDEGFYFTATYDSATTLVRRHNELWYVGDKADAPTA